MKNIEIIYPEFRTMTENEKKIISFSKTKTKEYWHGLENFA